MLNHAVAYNSLRELEIKLAPGYAEAGEAGSDEEEAELAAEPDESAPFSPRSRSGGQGYRVRRANPNPNPNLSPNP